jgi:hypothetical protein
MRPEHETHNKHADDLYTYLCSLSQESNTRRTLIMISVHIEQRNTRQSPIHMHAASRAPLTREQTHLNNQGQQHHNQG